MELSIRDTDDVGVALSAAAQDANDAIPNTGWMKKVYTKLTPKHPDLEGELIDHHGLVWRLVAWNAVSKKGEPYLSVVASRKDREESKVRNKGYLFPRRSRRMPFRGKFTDDHLHEWDFSGHICADKYRGQFLSVALFDAEEQKRILNGGRSKGARRRRR